MLFNSFEFGIFLPVVAALFFAVPARGKTWVLLLASYYFYMRARPEYGALLFASTVLNYVAGLGLAQASSSFTRKSWLAAAVILNLGGLFYYKYYGLFALSANAGLQAVHASERVPVLQILLPIGISFFTFQALSYCIDVYRGHVPPEKRFDLYALYHAFFPQLVAGPIERPGHILPQMHAWKPFCFDRVASGARLIGWGLFKKLVIADRLGVLVGEVYGAPASFTGVQLGVASYAFGFQILCDFSAYTDIARGCGRILGVELMENFRSPYFAASIPEFWRRWHISLSTWFRDYLYIPLGGNRRGFARAQLNIVIVFLVSGIWHGADWKFAIWGLLHAFYFVAWTLGGRIFPRPEIAAVGWRAALSRGLGIFLTFQAVSFAWIFFRAASLHDAELIIHKICHLHWRRPFLPRGFAPSELFIAVAALCLMEAGHWLRVKNLLNKVLAWPPIWLRWPVYYAAIVCLALFAKGGRHDFIYFQF